MTRPAWRDGAACNGLDPARWFPERTGASVAAAAKAVCAACPVQPQCLEHALEAGEREGIWGGSSPRERRRLSLTWSSRAHDWRAGCGCDWCTAVNDLGQTGDVPSWINGPNARHGYKATYARGGRCGLCCFRMSVAGQRLAAAGVDVPAWWWWWFRGRRGRCTGGGDREARDLLWKAMVLAYADLADGYALGQVAA